MQSAPYPVPPARDRPSGYHEPSTEHLIDWFRSLTGVPSPAVMVVVAHPDDETIGAGGLLTRMAEAWPVWVIHVTDGAPRDRRWWGGAKLAPREEYARIRREELRAALALAGLLPEQMRCMGVVDQETSLEMAGVVWRILDLLYDLHPTIVLTHAYEGGHPDHDATAFAVHAAHRLFARQSPVPPPIIIEMPFYRAGEAGIVTGEFLPAARGQSRAVVLSPEECERKRQMLACFATQQETLRQFTVGAEQFRRVSDCDFTRAPHRGRLFYENFEWGTTGKVWRHRAREALRELGLEEES